MEKLIGEINKLKQSEVSQAVEERLKQFANTGKGNHEDLFSELCFCILAANYTSHGASRIQQEIENGFLTLGELELAAKLRELGYRFPNVRAKYICEARGYAPYIKELQSYFIHPFEKREWLADKIKGIGYKEASHFLRNTGNNELAIIDFHVIDLLEKHGLAEKPKSMNRKRYLEIEETLGRIAKETNTSQGELDLYLWFMETGKVLK